MINILLVEKKIPIYFSYITKEFFLSFFVCFLFFFCIFFVNQILLLAERVLSKRIPAIDVLLLLIYFIPNMISLSFPFAVLVGCMMAISRFSSENEILSMQASGLSHKQIFSPLFITGIFLTIFSFFINDFFLPLGTIKYMDLYRKLVYSNPELEIESFSAKRYMDTTLITGKVDGKDIDDIIIIDRTTEGDKRYITAEKAVIENDKDGKGVISLNLSNVFSHVTDQKKEMDYSYFSADKMVYNILLSDFTTSIQNLGPREMSSYDVFNSIKEMKNQLSEEKYNEDYKNDENYMSYTEELMKLSSLSHSSDKKSDILDSNFGNYMQIKNQKYPNRSLQIFSLEYNKKFSLPAACIFFVLFSYPVGLFLKRSGRSIGFGLGLLISVLYWCMLFAGHTLGIRSNIAPILAMWMPNFIIFILAFIAYVSRFAK